VITLEVVRVVERRQRHAFLDPPNDILVDQDRLRVVLAGVHHPVPDAVDFRQIAQQAALARGEAGKRGGDGFLVIANGLR